MIVQSLLFGSLFLLFYVAKSKMHLETYERRLPSFSDGPKKKSFSGSQGVLCSLINEYVCVPDIGNTYVYQGLGVE